MKQCKKTVALSVHGINSKNGGKDSIDRVAHGMAVDYVDVDDTDYGWVAFFRTTLFRRRFIERVYGGLKRWVEDDRIGKIFVAVHSNGLNFTLQALDLLKERGVLTDDSPEVIIISFSGCANRKVNTDNATKVYNLHTKHDGWLKVAKFSPSFRMGSFGLGPYRGKSINVENWNRNHRIRSHSQWFVRDDLTLSIRDANITVEENPCV